MSVDWLQQGESSQALLEKEKAQQEQRKAEMDKAFRFFISETPKGSGHFPEAPVIFVDGMLSKNGMLQPPRWYEHSVFVNGEWKNFVCPQETLPAKAKEDPAFRCPICEGKDRAYLASGFTVIDLRPYTTKKGVTIPFTRKLFVAKPTTFEMLNTMAKKRGGLAGWRVDIGRTGSKAAATGDVFDFQSQFPGLVEAFAHVAQGKPGYRYVKSDELIQKFTRSFKAKDAKGMEITKTVCDWEPLDYQKEIPFRTGDELRQLGFGAPMQSMSGSGAVQQPSAEEIAGTAEEIESQL